MGGRIMDDLEIRESVADYIVGALDAGELEDRLENVAWELEGEPARSLAGDVLRLLAEHGNGDWEEAELRERLGAMSRTYWFQQAPKVAWSGSDASVMRHQEPSVVAGRSRATESA
jgi:hypothetical protein